MEPSLPDTVPLEGYEVVERLGEGAMGCVYRARHVSTERPIALKVLYFSTLPPDRREVFRTRFRRESLLVLSLEHPHLVRGYDADVQRDFGYLAMEFLEGPSLQVLIDRHGGLPLTPVLVVMDQLADAIGHLERRGIVHRDIKPSNVIIGRGGVAKLCDFGLSRTSDVLSARVTVPNVPLGTIDTMPPEQVRAGHEADTRSDLYALAATAFWALTGKPPFHGDNPYEVLACILEEPAPRLADRRPDLDPAFCEIIASLLEKSPGKRLKSAADLKARLAPMLAAVGVSDALAARTVLAEFSGVRLPSTRGGAASRRMPQLPVPGVAPEPGTVRLPALAPPEPERAPAGDEEMVVTFRGDSIQATRVLRPGGKFVIGRATEADVCVRATWVSRKHVNVELTDRGLLISDLGSANGTFLNEKRVNKAVLRDGDVLRLGKSSLEVEIQANAFADGGSTHDVEFRCEGCGEAISLSTFADGEVISLDHGFLCPRCAEARKAKAFDVERRALDTLLQSGYEVLERIDLGTPAPVFKALERVSPDHGGEPRSTAYSEERRVVSVKVVPARDVPDAVRLVEDVWSAVALRHPNIASTYSAKTVDDLVLVVGELVDGETLAARIARRGKLSAADVVVTGLGVASALEYAYGAGLLHRDLRPENVMVGPRGHAKVLDFGLAPHTRRMVEREAPLSRKGLPSYVAPERHADPRRADLRGEIYALGGLLYHALTGEPPARVISKPGASPSLRAAPDIAERGEVEAPQALVALIGRCLQADPAARPASFTEVAAGLVRLERILGAVQGANDPNASDELQTSAIEVNTIGDSTVSIRTSDYAGWIRGRELVDFARYVGVRRRSGELTIVTRDSRTKLFVRDGQVVHVEPESNQPRVAVIAALAATEGAFRFRAGDPEEPKRSCSEALGDLVAEAERRLGG